MQHAAPVLSLAFAAVLGPCASSEAIGPFGQPASEISEFIELVSAARADAQCAVLVWNDAVAEVAKRHSEDMRDRDFFAHENPDGESPFDRLTDAGIRYRAAGENILVGTTSGRRAFELWMSSPGHRANLLNCSFTQHGVGVAETHWTHVFIRP